MTLKVIAPPPSRSRSPPDPPPPKLPLLGSLSPLEPLEPPDPHRPSRRISHSCSLPFYLDVYLSLCCIRFFHESLIFLGFLTSFAVASCERWCQCSLLILWLLCSPCPSLMTSLVPDLSSTAWTSSRGDGSRQTSDLKTFRRPLPFSSPWKMTVLPSGNIYSTWFWSMNLLSDDQLILLCSPQPPLISAHSDHNDQWLSFDSRKSLWVHHGNAGVDRFCWELRHAPSMESCLSYCSLVWRSQVL
ncbi:hypothetical protein F2Q68_00039868 [Brassica cretica]|uniref:Uncharacterized protein n=1 Tax=Brassica cretica TaxID=69181 RepID=A0A8S9MHQ1_BRACR|nr:hypothetical protein F2Q68_00039868 [Brassica cretica]